MTKIRLDPHFKHRGSHASVTCTGPVLEMDLDEKRLGKTPAEAIASAVERGIASNPHQAKSGRRRWVRSGKLAMSIAAVPDGNGYNIVGPPDRLQDPEMIQQITEDVRQISDPLSDPLVKETIDKTVQTIVKAVR